MLGYQLTRNVLRCSAKRYGQLCDAVADLERRGWARPREVESIVGRFTHVFLLQRPVLSVFSAVYAFGRKCGSRMARVWPAVLRELRMAADLLVLVRSDLARPVAPVLIQTDACDTGAAAVYTSAVSHVDLRRECRRPRKVVTERALGEAVLEPWTVEKALAADFTAPVDPAVWSVAIRRRYQPGTALACAHINEKELCAAVDAVRWSCSSSRTRSRRLVVQSDFAVAVAVLRKGRSSKPALLQHCRRFAALALAEQVTVEARWVPTDRNMADRPSRGDRAPGPCLPEPAVRPRGRGQGGFAGIRVGEAKKPGPGPPRARSVPPLSIVNAFWTPLLDGNISVETRRRYAAAVLDFLGFVRDHGDRVTTAPDLDYWLAYYAHVAYTTGARSKSSVEKALYGSEHWLPELKPLPLARRCVTGWGKLVPPSPAAPMPRDLVHACAAAACLAGDVGAGLAMLVSFDCWLRISEVAGLTPDDVVDTRGHVDPVGRGISVYLNETKTGRRQAVQIEDPAVARLVLAWATVVRRTEGARARLFPAPAALRAALARALAVLDDGMWETRGLHFVWHSLRHGGASRAHLAGRSLPAILLRGRWKAEGSGRHYIQAGRQMLLALALPRLVVQLAGRVARIGLVALIDPDLRTRLRSQ